MVGKRVIKSGLKILIHNPRLCISLLTFDFHKIYCSYFKQKLNESRKIYQNFGTNNNKLPLLEKIQGNAGHIFSSNLKDHLAAVDKLRKTEAEVKS